MKLFIKKLTDAWTDPLFIIYEPGNLDKPICTMNSYEAKEFCQSIFNHITKDPKKDDFNHNLFKEK